jgi:hypothetical protein
LACGPSEEEVRRQQYTERVGHVSTGLYSLADVPPDFLDDRMIKTGIVTDPYNYADLPDSRRNSEWLTLAIDTCIAMSGMRNEEGRQVCDLDLVVWSGRRNPEIFSELDETVIENVLTLRPELLFRLPTGFYTSERIEEALESYPWWGFLAMDTEGVSREVLDAVSRDTIVKAASYADGVTKFVWHVPEEIQREVFSTPRLVVQLIEAHGLAEWDDIIEDPYREEFCRANLRHLAERPYLLGSPYSSRQDDVLQKCGQQVPRDESQVSALLATVS